MNSTWQPPPPDLNVLPGQVHIFRLDLSPSPAGYALLDLLDEEERARARRLIAEGDRQRFITAHGQLRQVLGRLLNTAPSQLHFQKNEFGKPALPGQSLRFNLSHSRSLGLLAAVVEQEVGVDVEAIRPEVNHIAIARRFFAPEEQQVLQALSVEDRQMAFFQCWTRKEAYIKARGMGLKIPLGKFAVSLAPGEPARLLHPEPGAPTHWHLHSLEPGPGYCGAVMVEGSARDFLCWDWPLS